MRKLYLLSKIFLRTEVLFENLIEFQPIDTHFWGEDKTSIDETIEDSKFGWKSHSLLLLKLLRAAAKRMLFVEHLMQDDAHCPKIAFYCIWRSPSHAEIYFRSHCIRSTTTTTLYFQLITQKLRQSEVCNLEVTLSDENVFELEVAVDDISLLQDLHALHELFEIAKGNSNFKLMMREFVPKVALAELEDYAALACMGEDIDDSDDVLRVEFSQALFLAGLQRLNLLHGHCLARCLNQALPHSRVSAPSQLSAVYYDSVFSKVDIGLWAVSNWQYKGLSCRRNFLERLRNDMWEIEERLYLGYLQHVRKVLVIVGGQLLDRNRLRIWLCDFCKQERPTYCFKHGLKFLLANAALMASPGLVVVVPVVLVPQSQHIQ